jgi:hypothetical protein
MIGLSRKDGIELFADGDRRPTNSWEQITARDG